MTTRRFGARRVFYLCVLTALSLLLFVGSVDGKRHKRSDGGPPTASPSEEKKNADNVIEETTSKNEINSNKALDQDPDDSKNKKKNKKNADSGKDSSKIVKDMDSHGCCLSCGEFWCAREGKCVTDWDSCSVGEFNADTCSMKYKATELETFSYDLSPLTLLDTSETPFYRIHDMYSHAGQEFDYYFNFCKTIPTSVLPKACQEPSVGSALEECTNDAMAYQFFKTAWNYTSCYRLSHCYEDGPAISMGLIDPVKPASGVYIEYTGGNLCANSYSDKSSCTVKPKGKEQYSKQYCARSFRVNIYCHDEINEIPVTESISETSGCGYIANINHAMGCPKECPRASDGSVCSARGLCFYSGYDAGSSVDQATGSSAAQNTPAGLQCLCMNGYTGAACDQIGVQTIINIIHEKGTRYGPGGVISWFSFLGIVAVLGTVAYIATNYSDQISSFTSGLMFDSVHSVRYTSIPTDEGDDRVRNPANRRVNKPFYGDRNAAPPGSSHSPPPVKHKASEDHEKI